jgi:hypothetical protein
MLSNLRSTIFLISKGRQARADRIVAANIIAMDVVIISLWNFPPIENCYFKNKAGSFFNVLAHYCRYSFTGRFIFSIHSLIFIQLYYFHICYTVYSAVLLIYCTVCCSWNIFFFLSNFGGRRWRLVLSLCEYFCVKGRWRQVWGSVSWSISSDHSSANLTFLFTASVTGFGQKSCWNNKIEI